MKFVLVQSTAHGQTTVASVCGTLEELLSHPFTLPSRVARPRVHRVRDSDATTSRKLLRVVRQQTLRGQFIPLPVN